MKETIIGTRLTKRRQRTVSSKDSDAAEWMHKLAQRKHWGYDGAARESVENLAKYLEERGLPYLDKTIVIDGGQWRYLRDGENEIDLPRPSRTTGLCKYLEDEFGYQSFQWYAGRIIELSHLAFDKQNIPAAIELGYLMHQFKFKQEDEGLAIETIHVKAINKGKGEMPKRRLWADDLAAVITCWEDIPESYAPMEIETDQADLTIYRDGNNVVCKIANDRGERTQKLAKSTFEKRYLLPISK